jgi:hypothetical protein
MFAEVSRFLIIEPTVQRDRCEATRKGESIYIVVIALALCLVCVLRPHPALACAEPDYSAAVKKLADSSFDSAEHDLMMCGDDPTAKYLVGLFPRVGRFSPEKVEEYRQSLSDAADLGLPAAQAVYGAWLYDTNRDPMRGAELITKAYRAEDVWGLGIAYRRMSAQGLRFPDYDLARVKRLADSGFPLAFGILAGQALYRIVDNQNALSTEEQAHELQKTHELALEGVIRGDTIAVLAALEVEKKFDVSSRTLTGIYDALTAPDPVAFSSSNSERMHATYVSWQSLFVFYELDNGLKRLAKEASVECSSSIASDLKELCEIRAIADHYVCMNPFASFVDAEEWFASSAYATCRQLRLRGQPADPFY